MIDDLKPLLQQLPEPEPPSSIAATVMSRIEREADRRAEAHSVAPARAARELSTWLWTFIGIALVVILFANGWLSLNTPPDLTSPRVGAGRALLIPIQGPAMGLVGVGLLIYLAGLFGPLRSSGRD